MAAAVQQDVTKVHLLSLTHTHTHTAREEHTHSLTCLHRHVVSLHSLESKLAGAVASGAGWGCVISP